MLRGSHTEQEVSYIVISFSLHAENKQISYTLQ